MTIQLVLGDFSARNITPKPHDNSNISRYEAEANKLKKKVETIKDTIAAHDDSLFNANEYMKYHIFELRRKI